MSLIESLTSEESVETNIDPFEPLISSRGLKIVHMNSRGLSDCKLDQLSLLVNKTKIDVLCLSETHIRDELTLANCGMANYGIFAQRREMRTGWGGVLIYVHQRHQASLHVSGSARGFDFVVVQIKPTKSSPFLIACVYRNPNSRMEDSASDIKRFLESLSGETVITGDMNFSPKSQLDRIFTSESLFQLIKQPTRVTDESASTIDLIYTNNRSHVQASGVIAYSIADHLTTFVVRKVNPRRPQREHHILSEYRCWKKFSFTEFQRLLSSANVDVLAFLQSADVAVEAWTLHVNNCLDQVAPIKKRRVRNIHRTPWLDTTVVELMCIRDHWHKRFLVTRSFGNTNYPIFWKLYKKLRNMVVKLIRRKKRSYYEDVFQETNFTGKCFWKNIKPFLPNARKAEKLIEDLDSVNQSFVEEPIKIRDHQINREHFVENGSILWDYFPLPAEVYSLPEPTFDKTSEMIRQMDIKKATGCDNIGARVLKSGGGYIAEMLTEIVRTSFRTSKFPEPWKMCRVTALEKSDGSRRPITVIPSSSKIQEQYVVSSLLEHLEKIKFWKPYQFGFRKNHSTTCALLCIQQLVASSLEAGLIVVALLIDFKKAFDLLDHQLLLDILLRLNCDEQALEWFRCYLSKRKQRVEQGSRKSSFIDNNLGVPQGSKLGPILFVIYVMSLLGLRLKGKIYMYADDATLIYVGSNQDDIEADMNEDLETLRKWCAMYSVVINCLKTHYIFLRGRKDVCNMNIFFGDQQIARASSVKLLGVTLTESFQFDAHIREIHEKAAKRVNLLFRLRNFLPTKALSIIYKCSIEPLFLYCSPVWRWSANSHLEPIIKLQKKAARAILFKSRRESSAPLFKIIGWSPVKSLWDIQTVMLIKKACLGETSELLKVHFLYKPTSRTRSSDDHLLAQPFARLETFLKRTVFINGIKLYNSLAKSTRDLDSLTKFAVAVKRHF